jgi:short-subunit dehydrogenase
LAQTEPFRNKVVLITGASSGIGAALAREFGAGGAHLALLARRTNRLEVLASDVARTGSRVLALRCDVTSEDELRRVSDTAKALLGKLDVVVANAGFGVVGRFDQLTLDDYRRQFETNIFGVLRTIYATLDELKRSQGRLVLIGSVAGYISSPGSSPYGMSKFALRALAQSLFHELASSGVSVTLVSPGFVDSEIRQVDNKGIYHADAADPIPRWLRVPADKVAKQIVRAVAKRRREVVVTTHGKVLAMTERHAPWLVSGVIGRGKIRGRSQPAQGF